MGNHVKFARFVLLGVSEQAKNDFNFFRSMCNKTIIRFGFCDIQTNRSLGKGYQPQLTASADNPYLNLEIILDITKPHPIIVYCLAYHTEEGYSAVVATFTAVTLFKKGCR